MAANLPPVNDASPKEKPSGEPVPGPDLMGYKSVDELVAAKRASDAEAKRIAEENAALKAGRSQPAADPVSDEPDEDAEFETWVDKNDPVAKRVRRIEHAIILKDQLRDIPDKDEREATKNRFLANTRKYGYIYSAHEA
jgi:hypothetical protein